ncbi:ABC transporter substrate-binding protein [Psychromonas ossibalaenae]|uniref:ABC transporter substrate-binding protein n=1 Tax=Psychromonas ossibalaenae TaxID=444922 RepID=UPI00037CBA4D|nr:ABC transporter substrate-binding protein [Psychromonas ossibalaenae]
MHKILKQLILLIVLFPALGFAKPSALLLNPGKRSESFWQDVDLFANAAAARLELEFNIFHAERNNYLIIKEVERLIKNKQLPDYLLLVNEKKILPKLLTLLEGQDVYVFVILNGLPPQQRSKLLEKPHWQKYLLTSLIPDNYWIGLQTAKGLIAAGNGQAGDVIMISGDKTTPASIERQAGAIDYFNSQPHIKLNHVVYADWSQKVSYKKSLTLVGRVPKLKYIWTANDLMAFGSLDALGAHDLQAGEDVFISTINTSAKVLALKKAGKVSTLGGGHFTAAGWALVLANQHSKGKNLPKLVRDPLFQLIKPDTEFYRCLITKNWDALPFEKITADAQGDYIFNMKAHQNSDKVNLK